MKLQNIPEGIKKQWSLIKVATDYIKICIFHFDPISRRINHRLIEDTLNGIDTIFGMRDISTINQNHCIHTRSRKIDGVILITDDNPRMFKCTDCDKRFQINVPTPKEIDTAAKQISEFILSNTSDLESICSQLESICLMYKKIYDSCNHTEV